MTTLETPTPPEAPKSIRRYVPIVLVVGFIAFIAFGLSLRNRSEPTSGPAPDFSMTFYSGYDGGLGKPEAKLSDLRGKVVVLNFWASWCIPCAQEAPDLEATYVKYKDRDVFFLGIAWTDIDTDALNFLRRFNITYANAPDLGNKVGKPLYQITGVPETFIIDRAGNVQFFGISPLTEAELSAQLDKILAQ
ncbi:MAG TPA: redoxin domain-containing protein [Anaerolineae bacterium]|nr:redoxin domain-containing protein [Anaerolineae bacterium]